MKEAMCMRLQERSRAAEDGTCRSSLLHGSPGAHSVTHDIHNEAQEFLAFLTSFFPLNKSMTIDTGSWGEDISRDRFSKALALNWGLVCPLRGTCHHLDKSWWDCPNLGRGCVCCWYWVGRGKDAAQYPTKYWRTPSPGQRRTYVAHSVTTVQAENPDLRTMLCYTANMEYSEGRRPDSRLSEDFCFLLHPMTHLQNPSPEVLTGPRSVVLSFINFAHALRGFLLSFSFPSMHMLWKSPGFSHWFQFCLLCKVLALQRNGETLLLHL